MKRVPKVSIGMSTEKKYAYREMYMPMAEST